VSEKSSAHAGTHPSHAVGGAEKQGKMVDNGPALTCSEIQNQSGKQSVADRRRLMVEGDCKNPRAQG